MPTKITRFIALGDSLSDRGTLDRRELLGFIPMSYLSGLSAASPKGRFTNGFLWGDFVSATIAEEFEIEQIRTRLGLANDDVSNADIGDELISNDHHFRQANHRAFRLNKDTHVLYKGHRFARFYCEGGLTAHNYFYEFTFNPIREFSRLILSHLSLKRDALLADDKHYKVSAAEKAETLVVEWSGANDLITVNEGPSFAEVDKAVAARIKNAELLIRSGYRNVVLFNLPNLALTPRYQAKSEHEQRNAAECSSYFNEQLAAKAATLCERFSKLHIKVNLSIFDAHTHFNTIYNHPERYHLEADKRHTPFIESEEFKEDQANPHDETKHLSPAKGYMFWDDVHPSAEMHAWLADAFKQQYQHQFQFQPPERSVPSHIEHHDASHPNLPDNISALLDRIHAHAKVLNKSLYESRREKGALLQNLVFEIKSHKGDMTEIAGLMNAFVLNPTYMSLVSEHNHAVFDFFRCKDRTHSETLIDELVAVIDQSLRASNLSSPS